MGNKFMEGNFEKLERLLEMHDEYSRSVKESDAARLNGQVQRIDRELEVDDEEQLFLDRCDAGLFTLQQLDIILIRLANMGNRQATDEIGKLLDIKGVPLEEVCNVIEEYCSHLDTSAKAEQQELRNFAKALVDRCIEDEKTAKALRKTLGFDQPERSSTKQAAEGKKDADEAPKKEKKK